MPPSTPVKRKVHAPETVKSSNKRRKIRERSPSPMEETSESEGLEDSSESESPARRPSRHRSLSVDSLPEMSRCRSRSIDSVPESPILSPQPQLRSIKSHSVRCLMDAVVISPNNPLPVPIYRRFRNEVEETKGLKIPGESEASEASDRDLPVRNLDQFTFYGHDGRYVPFALIARSFEMEAGRTFLGSGVVTRRLQDPSDGDSDIESVDTELLVTLQPIVKFWVGYDEDEPATVWIQTHDAWYILNEPAPLYTTFYQPFWIAHHLTWTISNAIREDPEITPRKFLQDRLIQENAASYLILGRDLVAEDLKGKYATLYIIDQLSSIEDSDQQLLRTPLLENMVRRANRMHTTIEDLLGLDLYKPLVRPVHGPMQTVTMPLVHELTTGIFFTSLLKAGKELNDEELHHKLLKAPEPPDILHPDFPTNIEWEVPLKDFRGYFSRVCLDGEAYNVGDIVMVNPGEDDVEHRAKSAIEACSRSGNALGNKVWFCKIIHMHNGHTTGSNTNTDETVHVQWYLDGAKTILQETAHPYGLFALAECADIPVGAILGRCNVQHLKPGNQEPNTYHCSFLWDADQCRFLDQAILAEQVTIENGNQNTPFCPSCAFNAKHEEDALQETFIHSKIHVQIRGIHYHKDDFVYIAATPRTPYIIGQIQCFLFDKKFKLENIRVELNLLGRYDDVVRAVEEAEGLSGVAKDELRLFMTDQVEAYPLPLLEGKCFVHAKEETAHPAVGYLADHFYVDKWARKVKIRALEDLSTFHSHSLAVCKRCIGAADREQQKLQDYLECQPPLRAMELFAGAGGLSTGLEQSGFVKTCWAVEVSSEAASTFQANHPGARVYNQDTNICLQSAIDVRECKPYCPLLSLGDGKELPPMPQRGDVDLITGGFPCQSFSGMNHQRHKRPDDIRTTLVANMLSYVEFYQPQYVLMENVKGLLQHHIRGSVSKHKDDGERIIKMGIVKFVLRALTCLGYQAQLKVLQASEYGSPQNRERVIFWGARRSHALPEYPFPTHIAFDYSAHVINLPTHDKLFPARRSERECAPFRALVVSDAISDLPGFDWKKPRRNMESQKEKRPKKWPELSAVSITTGPLTGFLGPVKYASPPNTRYQKVVRGDQREVTLHCSRTYREVIVERVWHVCSDNVHGPNDLPRSLWTEVMKKSDYKKLKDIWRLLFSRLQWNKPFTTALTSCRPLSKGGRILHPTQRRILTARECARSQGFPDSYEFVQSEENTRPEAWGRLLDDIHKQIGNAVPVPLARALGDSLGKALLKRWSEARTGVL